jgi:hypothetical protein
MSDSSQSEKKAGEQPQPPPWLRATLDDLLDLDFEAPIAESKSADSAELSDLFRIAANPAENGQTPDTPAGRVFSMLWAVTGMHFRSKEPNEPFGAMMTFADGRRSAVPADFRGSPVEVLAHMASRAKHAVLRARLADISWLLERKRAALAGVATEAYVEIVRKVDAGTLKFRFDTDHGALKYDARDLLRRALLIERAIAMDKSGPSDARDMVAALRARAIEKRLAITTDWFAGLDLDFGISDPAGVGEEVEAVIPSLPSDTDPHSILELWRLVARAYHLAKRDNDKYRAQAAAAEQLVGMAEHQTSAMLGSHFLAEAIAELHGVPGKKDRRRELNHRLIDIQANISDEMSSFSVPIDLKDVFERTQRAMLRLSLRDKLFAFAGLARSPDPAQLVDQANKSISKYPLATLFGASHHDREGKVVHRSEGANFGDSDDNSAVARQIAQDEGLRRLTTVGGQIEPARQAIGSEHYMSDDLFAYMLQYSPFVPQDLLGTFSRGFTRFFQGDFVSALYLLTPLLENSLRHVLKVHGHEVSKFDDAKQTQEDRTISSPYEQMRIELDSIFGDALTTDIENVFLKKPGPYLRHGLAHGLLHDGDPSAPDAIYACWLIFHLCMLPLFPHRSQMTIPFEAATQDITQEPSTALPVDTADSDVEG